MRTSSSSPRNGWRPECGRAGDPGSRIVQVRWTDRSLGDRVAVDVQPRSSLPRRTTAATCCQASSHGSHRARRQRPVGLSVGVRRFRAAAPPRCWACPVPTVRPIVFSWLTRPACCSFRGLIQAATVKSPGRRSSTRDGESPPIRLQRPPPCQTAKRRIDAPSCSWPANSGRSGLLAAFPSIGHAPINPSASREDIGGWRLALFGVHIDLVNASLFDVHALRGLRMAADHGLRRRGDCGLVPGSSSSPSSYFAAVTVTRKRP